MERKRKNRNIVDSLCNIESGNYQSPLRVEQQIQRELIESDGFEYKPVWGRKSCRIICYDNGRLHFDHYSSIVSFHGPKYSPEVREIHKGHSRERVIDALIKNVPYPSCRCNAERCLCFHTYYILLTMDQWLLMSDYETGAIMDEVDLKIWNDEYDFSEGYWRDEGGQFFLHTEQSPNLTFSVVKSIAVFHASLKFQYMFEVERGVFGDFCRDAFVSGHFLITKSDPDVVEIYSLDDVLKEGVFLADEPPAREPTDRIRKNLEIQRAPPVLFKVGYYTDYISVGGYPYPCLYTNRLFHDMIKSDFPLHFMLKICDSYGEGCHNRNHKESSPDDTVAFYPLSNRVIVQKKGRVLLCELSNCPSRKLAELYEITIANLPDYEPSVSKTDEKSVLALSIEPNLNLIAILCVHPNDPSSLGFIKVYDGSSGEEVKTVALKKKLNARFKYKLHFHSDVIVMIKTKRESKSHAVTVFGLRRRTVE